MVREMRKTMFLFVWKEDGIGLGKPFVCRVLIFFRSPNHEGLEDLNNNSLTQPTWTVSFQTMQPPLNAVQLFPIPIVSDFISN